MRLPNQDVRSVDTAGRSSETDYKFKKYLQRFMHEAGKVWKTAKAIVGAPVGGDKGDGTLNAEKVYDNGNRVLTEAGRQTLAAGFDSTPKDHGTVTGGTLTIDPLDGQHQIVTMNGAITLRPAAAAKYTSVVLHVTNGASAGVVTFTGWTKKYPSASLNTTNGNKFNIVMYFNGSNGADYAIFARQ